MFAYNPTVNDNSGQITAAGTLAMAKGITDGVNSATGSVADGMGKAQMTREELDMMNGGMDFLAQQGAVDGGMLDKFHSGSLGSKRGIYNMAQLQYANMLKQQNIQMSQQGQAGGGGSVDYGAPLDIQ
jgi:hypothetical protein